MEIEEKKREEKEQDKEEERRREKQRKKNKRNRDDLNFGQELEQRPFKGTLQARPK